MRTDGLKDNLKGKKTVMDDQQFFAWIEEKGFNLTEAQRKAVVHDQGPLLLLAVPGAGKTMVLILRLAYLILVKKVNPDTILCLTFGRAAAKEMSDRFTRNFSKYITGNIHFSTIHSFAYEVVRTAFRQKGCFYQIIEELTGTESKNGVLRRLYQQINSTTLTEETLEELQNAICFAKNSLIDPEKLEDIAVENFVAIYKGYEKYKLRHQPQLIDFDDMLSLAYTVLVEDSRLLAKYQKRFAYILTDESQDTSLLQHKIIELLAKPKGNLFVVGDDDQSIFGFRAADPKYLLEFPQVYDQAEILRMEQNFRSTPEIVNISRDFIRSNIMRYNKEMITKNAAGEPVQVEIFRGNKEQNTFILGELKKNGAGSAVLYRNNLSVITLADELDRGGIPFYIRESKEERFFGHWVVEDILNFLRFSYSDQSIVVFEKIKTKLDTFISNAQMEYLKGRRIDRSIFDILSEQPEAKSRRKGYLTLKEQFKSLNKLSPGKAVGYIRNELGYDKVIERISKNLGFSKEYLNTLLNILEKIAARESTLLGFANRLNYLKEQIRSSYKNKGSEAVTLSTIHSAKGLEWERVYIIDLIQGIIPDSVAIENKKNNNAEGIEEERRLFYVAITRAQKHLTLCTMKQYQKQTAKISQFVQEVQALLKAELQRKQAEEEEIARAEREKLLKIAQAEREEMLRIARLEREKSERIAREEREKRRAGDFELHLAKRDSFFQDLTEKEEKLFLELCKKHGYTEDSFPGIFDVEVEHSALIQTPAKVWQLWIYDRCIYKKNDSDLLYITAIYDRSVKRIYDFIKLQDEGVFRTSTGFVYKFAFYEYIGKLVNLGIISMAGVRYYKILVNKIPVYNDRKENVLLKIALDYEDYACENVQRFIKQARETPK